MPRFAAEAEPRPAAATASDAGPSAKDSQPPPLHIGAYRIEGELGRGGMARVYRAIEESTGRRVALKQLHVHEDLRHPAAALFEREFHTLAQLSHPSVIEVYDYGLHERGPYYTMELLRRRPANAPDARSPSYSSTYKGSPGVFTVCTRMAAPSCSPRCPKK
jgi:serine/threonine protein kinase